MKNTPLILFLYNVEKSVAYGESSDLAAIQESEQTAALLIGILQKKNYSVEPFPVQDSLDPLREKLGHYSTDNVLVFNYCDTFAGNNLAAAEIAKLLDDKDFKHTGSTGDVITTCIRKGQAKKKFLAKGVPTPRFKVFSRASGGIDFTYPAFVKPSDDDASVGISHDSVVQDHKQMLQRVSYILERYHQDALVEEFIAGREFAVSLWGNGETLRVLPIAEMDYSQVSDPLNRILTYESKWEPGTFDFEKIPTKVPADLQPEEETHVKETALLAFQTIGLRDFGRVDIRFRNGTAFVIDINEIPDLGPTDGFSKSTRAAGFSHEDTIEQILKFALQREGML